MQLFSADATMFSKKLPSKVAHNWPKPFIPQPSPTHNQQPKIDFSYRKNVPPSICSLICVNDLVKYVICCATNLGLSILNLIVPTHIYP